MEVQHYYSIYRFLLKEIIAKILFVPILIILRIKFSKEKVLFILNYHNFSLYNNYHYKRGSILDTGFEKRFEGQLQFLKKYFNFCTPDNFYNGKVNHKINIYISFDDGYYDNLSIAAPILVENKVPAIIFVTTKTLVNRDFLLHDKIKFLVSNKFISIRFLEVLRRINANMEDISKTDFAIVEMAFKQHRPYQKTMMGYEHVKVLYDLGFNIGNHTHDHKGLTFLDFNQQFKSIQTANYFLEKETGVFPSQIAYPNGLYNNITIEVLDKLNFKFGYTTIGGYNNLKNNALELKRIGINASDSDAIILFKLFLFTFFWLGKSN